MNRREVVKTIGAVSAATLLPHQINAHQPSSLDARWFEATRRRISLKGKEIAIVEHGRGPVALFIHGWPLNGFHWRNVLPGVSEIRRCLVPDLMGLGYSEVEADQDLSPSAQAKMLVELLDKLDIGRVDIVANDSGTAIAQLIAVRNPERVRSILLTNGDVHTNCPPQALKPAIEAARAGELDKMFELHLTDPDFAASPMGLGSICYEAPESLTREAIDVYFRPLLANRARRKQAQQYGVAFEPNPLPAIEAQLRELAVPVRMVWGTGDIHFDIGWAYWLHEILPQSRGIRRLEGAKLFFPEEHAQAVVEEALFLWQV